MARRRRFSSNTVRSVGALLPSDVLAKAMDGDGLEGLEAEDYGLDPDARLRDAVNDAWNETKALWWRFRAELRDLSENDTTATALTRERWLFPLLQLLGFDDVEVVPTAIEVGGADYPISHVWGATPLHLMGAKVDLDGRVAGIRGAARLSPHSLLQQFINQSDDHLWGMVTNGFRLRILRDSVSLTRQAFVEFDLEAMFNGEVFVDFALLYRVAHATRFSGERPEDCLLERWIAAARNEGIRALDQLRDGVESALTTLGTGFLRHRDNGELRDAVDGGDLGERDMYRFLLRLVYRLLFLFVAEDRDLLHVPNADPATRERYDRFYSTARLRDLAARPSGSGHSDLWSGLRALMKVLGRDEGEPSLGLPGLGSFLWADDSIGLLVESSLDNEDLLTALRGLAHVDDDGTVRRIDFAGLGAEELGSVYESLLDLHPSFGDDGAFILRGGAGSERKITGSYYTPTELISELLDSALDPVLKGAVNRADPEKAILDLKVVDAAAGSGHFLVAAAHRIAKKLAEVRTREPEPAEEAYRTALRDVVSRCLFAVDINDLAVELCKVSLWLEALEPGKPLSFLDHHILVGNSLMGATPAAIADGIPDEAFVALTGDDRKVAADLKKRNRRERAGQGGLAFEVAEPSSLGTEIETLEGFDDVDLDTVRAKEKLLNEWKSSPAFERARLAADAWCAAFAIEKRPGSPTLTDATFRRLRDDGTVDTDLRTEIERLRERFRFFHWHLAFPQVFGLGDTSTDPGWIGGFDVVLGNPPWEKVEFSEKEWFASRSAEIAETAGATRKRLIASLETHDPDQWSEYQSILRDIATLRHFLSGSGVYPLCGRGKVNTYAVFAELKRSVVADSGRVGVIVPTGIATDETTKHFFADLVGRRSLVSLFDFENRKGIFPGIHRSYKFCLLTLTGPSRPVEEAEFVFFALRSSDLVDPDRRFTLTPDDFALLNPQTRTCPVFRSRRDAEIAKGIHRRFGSLSGTWGLRGMGGLNVGDNADLLLPHPAAGEAETLLPYWEAKMVWYFDHRFADICDLSGSRTRELDDLDHADPCHEPQPRYWLRASDFEGFLSEEWDRGWYMVWRDVTNATNARTLVPCVIPQVAFARNNLPAGLIEEGLLPTIGVLISCLSSFIADYIARQKVSGTHLTLVVLSQLPVPSLDDLESRLSHIGIDRAWVRDRFGELFLTADSLRHLASDVGLAGPPFRWGPERRPILRAELDAAFFHLYAVDRHEVDYIMETFPIVKRKDVAEHGTYRTKDLILDMYDRMTKAIETGEPYHTVLDPPPADPSLRVGVQAPS